jgi:RNA recognition motif-containing protein
MNTNDTRPRGRRPNNRNSRDHRRDSRDRNDRRTSPEARHEAPKKLSLWQKFLGLFSRKSTKAATPAASSRHEQGRAQNRPQGERRDGDRRRNGPPEKVEVTSPRLYVGNLNYDAAESDLMELFNGVGKVQNAEIVTHRDTYRSKGFGFVTMLTVDEAIRAVETLHDKDFMGRRLVVTGSRSDGVREPRV